MATKTFVPQCVKDAKKLSKYITKHEADLQANLGGSSGAQWLDVAALRTACNTVVANIPIVVETP